MKIRKFPAPAQQQMQGPQKTLDAAVQIRRAAVFGATSG